MTNDLSVLLGLINLTQNIDWGFDNDFDHQPEVVDKSLVEHVLPPLPSRVGRRLWSVNIAILGARCGAFEFVADAALSELPRVAA